MNDYETMKAAAIADIAVHLAEHGKGDWGLTREKYPKISESTWWRLVKAVSDGKPQAQIMEKAVRRAKEAMLANIPVPVSPEFMAKGGARAMASINFIGIFGRMFNDVEMLREYSTKQEPDGEGGVKEAIKNPVIFAKHIQETRNLVETYLRAMDQVYNHKRNQDFYDAIVATIAEESPEAAQRIMERLQKLNDETGMTINAGNMRI